MEKTQLITKIWFNDGYHNVKLNDCPRTFRQLDSFCVYNNIPKCFVKAQGGIYKITKQGGVFFVCRSLQDIHFESWYNIANDDNFIPNIH